jgi:hypothetical protein
MPRHPVYAILAEAAYAGHELTDKELAELELGAADRELVRKAAREAAFLHAGGERGRAHEHALRRSHEIIAGLPEEQLNPRYLHEPDNLDGLGPAELAARIPR